jgi:hypothetical protein
MACTNIFFAYNNISIEKIIGINYLFFKIKVQAIFLKSDLSGIIDRTNVDLGPIDVILKRAWKLQEARTLADVLLNCCDNQLTIV